MSNSTFLPLWTDDGTYYELKFQRDIKFDYDVEFVGSDSDIDFTLTTVSDGIGKSFTYTCGAGVGADADGGGYNIDLGESTGTGTPGLFTLSYGGATVYYATKDTAGAGALFISNSAGGDNAFVHISGTQLTSGHLAVWGDNFAMGSYDVKAYLDYAGGLKTSGGRIRNITTVNAATYDLLATDDIVHVTYTSTGAVTSLTLPTAQTVEGRVIVIKDAGGNAGTNNITVDTEAAQTIDGSATAVTTGDYDSITLYCDGSNWFII